MEQKHLILNINPFVNLIQKVNKCDQYVSLSINNIFIETLACLPEGDVIKYCKTLTQNIFENYNHNNKFNIVFYQSDFILNILSKMLKINSSCEFIVKYFYDFEKKCDIAKSVTLKYKDEFQVTIPCVNIDTTQDVYNQDELVAFFLEKKSICDVILPEITVKEINELSKLNKFVDVDKNQQNSINIYGLIDKGVWIKNDLYTRKISNVCQANFSIFTDSNYFKFVDSGDFKMKVFEQFLLIGNTNDTETNILNFQNFNNVEI